MRESVRDRGRLEHILDAIGCVEEFTRGVDYEEFVSNKMLRHAVTHNIQIVGEAAYKLTKEYCAAHPVVPWKDIISMRHILVHDYYNVRIQEIWNIVRQDLPPLRSQIEALLREAEVGVGEEKQR